MALIFIFILVLLCKLWSWVEVHMPVSILPKCCLFTGFLEVLH